MTIGARREDYLRGLARRSRHTPVAFRTGLAKFCRFVAERYRVAEDAPAHALRLEFVAAFAEALPEVSPALAPATRRNYVLAVRRFYRYLAHARVLELPAGEFDTLEESLRRSESRRRDAPRTASAAAIDALIVAARTCEEDLPAGAPEGDRQRAALRQMRNEALVRVLACGLRIGEALALVRGDLDARRRCARVREEHGKARTVDLSEEAWGALKRYLEMRAGARGGAGQRGEPVFARHDRGAGRRLARLTRQRVEQLFDEWRKAAGLGEHVTPGSIRQVVE